MPSYLFGFRSEPSDSLFGVEDASVLKPRDNYKPPGKCQIESVLNKVIPDFHGPEGLRCIIQTSYGLEMVSRCF
jgi:hypothetical protein